GLRTAVSDRWTQGLRHRVVDPFWLLDSPRTAPGQRAAAQTALDVAARAALCTGREVIPAPALHGRQIPSGLWNDGSDSAGPVGVWPQDTHGVYGAAKPRHPPARGGSGTPSEHIIPR